MCPEIEQAISRLIIYCQDIESGREIQEPELCAFHGEVGKYFRKKSKIAL